MVIFGDTYGADCPVSEYMLHVGTVSYRNLLFSVVKPPAQVRTFKQYNHGSDHSFTEWSLFSLLFFLSITLGVCGLAA